MSDENSEDRKVQIAAEFSDSIPIDKVWRHAFEGDGTTYFGLLGRDGVNRHFVLDRPGMSKLAAETFELARLSRHIASGNDPSSFKPSFLPFSAPIHGDGIVAPFVGPMMKIDRATLHLENLLDLLERYSADAELTAHEVGFEDPNVIWEIRFSTQPAAAIPLIIGDIAHNLRSALDLMVCDLARIQGKSAEGLKFPFAKDAAALEIVFRKDDHARLGLGIVDDIRALKPFITNGNKLLRGLHDIDVIDKHRLIIPAFLVAWQRHDMALRVTDSMRAENPGLVIPNIVFVSDGVMDTTTMQHGDKIRAKRGDDPLRYYKKHERGIVAKFPMQHSPFAGDEVIPTLDALREMVFEIVTRFWAKFQGANPNP